MARRFSVGGVVVAACVAVLLSAAPAAAQMGGLFGKVLNEKGEPVADAEVIFENKDAMMKVTGTKTNAKGEWMRSGLRSGQGAWSVEARKNGVSAGISDVVVRLNAQTEVPDLVLRSAPPPAAAGSASVAASLAAAGAAADNALLAEVQKLFTDAVASADAKNYAAAIDALTQAIAKMPGCGLCYLKLGEVQTQKKDLAAAEKAYLQIIEINDQAKEAGEAYAALTAIYNEQRRYDEAQKASQKAAALTGGAIGGDPVSLFNAGVILVNQSKLSEAKPYFERAIALDPKMADAHYWLAMSFVNEGKMAEAKAAAAQYLKLAPNGQYVDIAKELVK
jgi:tetratricopeptide (TPR) repeat protein